MRVTEAGTPRFIVGLPRAATTWMCRSLNEHSDAVAFGETMFWGKAHIPPRANGSYNGADLQCVKHLLITNPLKSSMRIPGPGSMQRLTPADMRPLIEAAFASMPKPTTPAEVFRTVANRLAQAEGKSVWIEKTPHHLLYADRILRHFPTARFVVMMRDPYSFLLSYKHQRGFENSDASRRRFQQRYHPAGGALVWRNSWRAAQHLLHRAPEQTLLVRLEQIVRDPREVLRGVQEFLKLDLTNAVHGIGTKVNSAFEHTSATLSDADLAWMNLISARDMASAGYQLRQFPIDPSAILRSAADLPSWTLRILLDLKRTTSGSVSEHLLHWLARNPNA